MQGDATALIIQLYRILTERFNEGELRTLCFELDVDYDSLPGDGKADKARELVTYLDRRDQIATLVEAGKERRPDISWPVAPAAIKETPPEIVPLPVEKESPAPVPTRQPFEPEMVLIPAGEFLMGSDPAKDKHAEEDEQPQHILYLPDYYLAKTPVTNAQYRAFVLSTGHGPPEHWEGQSPPGGKEHHPVVYVFWPDAVAYCRWLAEITGKPYRLPSEAEWEKGARGGDGRIYPWGDRWDATCCNTWEGGKEDTTPVGAYPKGASPYGLLDMAGNVWEWTASLYRPYFYRSNDGRNDPEADGLRVVRGGSWIDFQRCTRCARRGWFSPDDWYYYLGFRVVMPLALSSSDF